MLEVKHLDLIYPNRFQALWDVSIAVKQRETVCILGANGAGKSTLMNSISGLLKPAAGTIQLNGERIDRLPTHRIVAKGLSHVLERRRLFADMTVRENLLMGAITKRAWPIRDETLRWVREVLPIAEDMLDRRAGLLSGGQQQLVAIARGLMARPQLLLCDEPFLGLSPSAQDTVIDVFLTLKREGLTLLFIEQNTDLALELSDRGYILESGAVAASGPAAALLADQVVQSVYLGGGQ